MTDVLYIVGQGSKNGNVELRWSLRALAKHARNLGRVVVAGYPPKWLSKDVVRIRVQDIPGADYKHRNILAAILAAIDCGAVRGKFLYSSDDHYLVKDVDLDSYPVWFKRPKLRSLADMRRDGVPPSSYRLSLAGTRCALETAGYEAVEYSCHANTWMDSADAKTVRSVAADGDMLGLRYGYEPTCLFANVRQRREPFEAIHRPDCKIGRFNGPAEALEAIGGRDTFSIGERVFDNLEFPDWMESLWPPCAFEADMVRAPKPAEGSVEAKSTLADTVFVYCGCGGEYDRFKDFSKVSLLRNVPGANVCEMNLSDLPGELYAGISERDAAYLARLSIPLLPEFRKYRRVVWIDSDTEIVSPDFAAIADVETSGDGLAAATDRGRMDFVAHMAAISRDWSGRYFNSGVLVFDLGKIALPRYTALVREGLRMFRERPQAFRYRDQDIFNLFFDAAELPEKFNCFSGRVSPAMGAALVHYAGGRRGKDALRARIEEATKGGAL